MTDEKIKKEIQRVEETGKVEDNQQIEKVEGNEQVGESQKLQKVESPKKVPKKENKIKITTDAEQLSEKEKKEGMRETMRKKRINFAFLNVGKALISKDLTRWFSFNLKLFKQFLNIFITEVVKIKKNSDGTETLILSKDSIIAGVIEGLELSEENILIEKNLKVTEKPSKTQGALVKIFTISGAEEIEGLNIAFENSKNLAYYRIYTSQLVYI